MDEINHVLNYSIKLGGTAITVSQILYLTFFLFAAFFFIRWSIRYLGHTLTRRQVNPDLAQIILRIYVVVIIAVLFISALDLLNVPLTAFAFISGAIAIGFGFGAQNIINNFISGWILMWERPIRIGDFLEIMDTQGTVESINTRSTRIKRVDGVHILVPNSYLLENIVTNWTLVDRLARTNVSIGVAYGSPVKLVAELIGQAAAEHELVLDDPAPKVFFDDFGDSALIFTLNIWANASAESGLRSIRSELRFRIDELFQEHNIVIAFPQRDIHLDGTVVIKNN